MIYFHFKTMSRLSILLNISFHRRKRVKPVWGWINDDRIFISGWIIPWKRVSSVFLRAKRRQTVLPVAVSLSFPPPLPSLLPQAGIMGSYFMLRHGLTFFFLLFFFLLSFLWLLLWLSVLKRQVRVIKYARANCIFAQVSFLEIFHLSCFYSGKCSYEF